MTAPRNHSPKMTTPTISQVFKRSHKSDSNPTPHKPGLTDERARQLADIAADDDEDNAECAAADLAREFPSALP